VPNAGLVDTFRGLLAIGSERIDMLSVQQTLHRKHGPVVAQGTLGLRFVNLFGPDANRFVLLDRDRIFSSRRPWMRIMGKIFPNGLLLRDGSDHTYHRHLMHEAFKRPVLRKYADQMNPMIARGLDAWRPPSGELKAFHAIKELTLDIAASIFLGAHLGPGTHRMNGAFEDMVAASMSRLRLRLPGSEFHRGLLGREYMVRYLRERIASKRAGEADDMFALLARSADERGEKLADDDVVDHMVFLMMAAHDTTTSTLTSMVYELARHPEWQERLREESATIYKKRASYDDLDGLVGLSWTMKEALRLYPPLPVIPRVATAPCEFDGYKIDAGTMVVISAIFTHHMPEWWDEPDRFDPERFSPARAEQDRHTHSWIPFGGGPHMCLGMRFAEAQVRLIMHQLLRRYRWSVPEGYRMPVQQAPISKPLDGLPIRIEPI